MPRRLFEHINYQALDDSRLRLYEDDARHMLLASEDTYDVILSEPSHPWVTGVSNLFTREFFQLARVRLRPDGVFAQWVQAYEISFETYRTILATFQSVFPEVFVFVPPEQPRTYNNDQFIYAHTVARMKGGKSYYRAAADSYVEVGGQVGGMRGCARWPPWPIPGEAGNCGRSRRGR